MQNFNHNLRKLAKSTHWQTLFGASKMLYGVKLFENTTDFTDIQIQFVNWLAYYNSLNYYIEDGSLPDWAYKNDIYIDAFIYYIDKIKKKKRRETTEQPNNKDKNNKSTKKGNITLQGLKIVFKGKEKVI